MATPTVSASFNKATYADGELMTLTVIYGDPDRETITVTLKVADAAGNQSGPVTVSAVIDPVTVDFVDSGGRTWTQVSDSGTTAVYTATA